MFFRFLSSGGVHNTDQYNNSPNKNPKNNWKRLILLALIFTACSLCIKHIFNTTNSLAVILGFISTEPISILIEFIFDNYIGGKMGMGIGNNSYGGLSTPPSSSSTSNAMTGRGNPMDVSNLITPDPLVQHFINLDQRCSVSDAEIARQVDRVKHHLDFHEKEIRFEISSKDSHAMDVKVRDHVYDINQLKSRLSSMPNNTRNDTINRVELSNSINQKQVDHLSFRNSNLQKIHETYGMEPHTADYGVLDLINQNNHKLNLTNQLAQTKSQIEG